MYIQFHLFLLTIKKCIYEIIFNILNKQNHNKIMENTNYYRNDIVYLRDNF